jgi:Acetyltransferase (GNAT) domain
MSAYSEAICGENKQIGLDNIEVSVKGKWMQTPALRVHENHIIVKGKLIKMATVHEEEWLERQLEDPELCIRTLKQIPYSELKADIFTFSQIVPETTPKYEHPMELDSIAAIHLTSYRDWWEGLPQETRKNVRRSQKRDVVVEVRGLDDDVIRGIMDVNNESPLRQGRPNIHYGKTFDQVRKDHLAFRDRSDFICAYTGDEFIGFLWLIYCGKVASIMQLTPKARHHDKRPSNALIAKAVETCEQKGISHITYARFTYGKGDSPLREFKIRNGFGEILMPRFYVPLTIRGSFAIKAGLHRGLHGILPHWAITAGVHIRALCYDRLRRLGPV